MSLATALGLVGVVLVLLTNLMKTMIPLRALAMSANVVFAGYFYMKQIYPSCVLQLLLLPINGYRLREMVQLTRRVRAASRGDTMDWLQPFMRRRRYRRGDLLFSKGDLAEEMFYTMSGRYRVGALDAEIGPGEVFGELGLLAPEQHRTQTIECVEDGEVLVIGYKQVQELYYQNPEFGFYFLRLVAGRLFSNLETMERRLAEATRAARASEARTSPP
jgi:hypothetical protein